jgi:hypothetical protein
MSDLRFDTLISKNDSGWRRVVRVYDDHQTY